MTYDYSELKEMSQRWEQANTDCEKQGDWRPLVDYYTDDATYGWNYGPKWDFMAVGRDEIRDYAIGFEMDGLAGWTYPYQTWVFDTHTGDMVGLWKQIFDGHRPDGTPYALNGIQGSWFKYAGDFKFGWQRDFFDFGNVTDLYTEMLSNGAATDGMHMRINRVIDAAKARKPLPGWYKIGQTPAPLW